MYRLITTNGAVLGVIETVTYIKRHPSNDCYTCATEDDATGVAFNSTPYNLWGRETMIDGEETIIIIPIDGGHEISGLMEKSDTHADHLAEVDEIAIELFEQNLKLEEVNAEQDEAIIEIYEAMEVANNG